MATSGTVFDPNAISATVGNPNASAVSGINTGNSSSGFLGGSEPIFHSPVGAFGRSNNTGVFGFSDAFGGGTGVAGNTNAGTGVGVHGHTSTGVGVLGTSDNVGPAGRFQGDVEVTGDIKLLNQDVAEDFDIRLEEDVAPGSVMVFDADGKLHPCRQAYDRKVAGVIAGAGEFKPAIVLGRTSSGPCRQPIALVGKAYCLVDAELGPVEAGDLLTTSPTTGHAMKAENPLMAFGAVIGKALCAVAAGQALIPILIALQ